MLFPRGETEQSTKSAPAEATDEAKPPWPMVLTYLASGWSVTVVVQLEKTSAPAVQPTNPPP